MSIVLRNIGNSVTEYAQNTTAYAKGVARESLGNITLKKVSTICLGTIATLAVSNMQTAEAGPFAGGLCLLACIPLIEAPPLLAVCLAACGVATAVPGP